MARPTRKIHIDTIPSNCAETEMVDVIAKISALLLRVEARRQAKSNVALLLKHRSLILIDVKNI